jgi:hypothetical protein
MGKTSENEKHKLAAAFWNNMAAAFGVGGIVAPYFYYMTTPSLSSMQLGEALRHPGAYSVASSIFLAFYHFVPI